MAVRRYLPALFMPSLLGHQRHKVLNEQESGCPRLPSPGVVPIVSLAPTGLTGLDHLRSIVRTPPMSLLLDSYRKNAEAARLEAERSALPNVRARAVKVAARWTEMADQLAWVEREGRLRAEATRTKR